MNSYLVNHAQTFLTVSLNKLSSKKIIFLFWLALFFQLPAMSVSNALKPAWRAQFDTNRQFIIETYGSNRDFIVRKWQDMLVNIEDQSDHIKIQTVNNFFYNHIAYKTDLEVHGVEDFWTTPLETMGQGVGDCEDYVIAKYISLKLAGVETNKLRLVYVLARIGGPRSSVSQAHMVLGYFETPSAEPLILDSLVRSILPASEREDLTPIFSFNSEGLWAGATGTRSSSSPTSRLSRWRNVLERMEQQGIYLEQQ